MRDCTATDLTAEQLQTSHSKSAPGYSVDSEEEAVAFALTSWEGHTDE